MAKAKIASKNNPDTRGKKASDYFFNGKVVKVVMCLIKGKRFKAAMYVDDNNLVYDKIGNIIAWDKISRLNKATTTSSSNAAAAAA